MRLQVSNRTPHPAHRIMSSAIAHPGPDGTGGMPWNQRDGWGGLRAGGRGVGDCPDTIRHHSRAQVPRAIRILVSTLRATGAGGTSHLVVRSPALTGSP